jgi:alpha-tubulin suppressor-like RCC1 family protein
MSVKMRQSLLRALLIVGCTVAASPPGAQTYTSISVGDSHVCAVTPRGSVECWGNGGDGRNGDPAAQNTGVPRLIARLPHAVAVAAGGSHTCATTSTYGVFCWGWNTFGQLGSRTNTSSDATPQGNTTNAVGVGPFRGIASGQRHSCALKDTGEVYCWGDNALGQRGSAAASSGTSQSTDSNQVVGLPAATAIAAGAYHTCAILINATVRCWGSNFSGELGSGSTGSFTNTPQIATGLNNVTSIAAGGSHTCAVSGGSVYCWGYGETRQNGSVGDRNVPTHVAGVSNATLVAAGESHSCALLTSGQVVCWGDNEQGQLGDEFATLTPSASPVAVSGISTATALAAGRYNTCILESLGRARCWGNNGSGQVGSNAQLSSAIPKRVAAISDAAQIVTGGATACVRHMGGTVSCWGANWEKQAGFGGSTHYLTSPQTIAGLTGVTSVGLGYGHGCALISNGTVRCWGDNSVGQLGIATPVQSPVPLTVPGISTATAIATGEEHTCALLSQGSVRCWGRNGFGQLGDGSSGNFKSTPVDVVGLGSTASAIAAGEDHTCAIVGANVRCWGRNHVRQLGNGTTTSSTLPVTVQNVSGTTALFAGRDNNCALVGQAAARQAWCWGANGLSKSFFLLTQGNLDPVNISWMTTRQPSQLALGPSHSCLRAEDGSATCLGPNDSGQLGIGTSSSNNLTFSYRVARLESIAQISAGVDFTCALRSDGSVWCWGAGFAGQLADGHSAQTIGSPQYVVDGKCSLDLDDNGSATAASDGLMLTRALLGLSGARVTQNALGAGATRNTWGAIRAHLIQNCGLAISAP